VRIFGRKSKTRRTVGSHQIQVFHHHSEQLIDREARGELEEALAHVLGARAPPRGDPATIEVQPNYAVTASPP
jgi:hypothetical protein